MPCAVRFVLTGAHEGAAPGKGEGATEMAARECSYFCIVRGLSL